VAILCDFDSNIKRFATNHGNRCYGMGRWTKWGKLGYQFECFDSFPECEGFLFWSLWSAGQCFVNTAN